MTRLASLAVVILTAAALFTPKLAAAQESTDLTEARRDFVAALQVELTEVRADDPRRGCDALWEIYQTANANGATATEALETIVEMLDTAPSADTGGEALLTFRAAHIRRKNDLESEVAIAEEAKDYAKARANAIEASAVSAWHARVQAIEQAIEALGGTVPRAEDPKESSRRGSSPAGRPRSPSARTSSGSATRIRRPLPRPDGLNPHRVRGGELRTLVAQTPLWRSRCESCLFVKENAHQTRCALPNKRIFS